MPQRLKYEKPEAPEIKVVGISSSSRDYEIAHSVNTGAGINLVRQTAIPVFHEKSQLTSVHAFYTCHDEVSRRTFDMIFNRSSDGPAIALTPPMDFILVIHGRTSASEFDNWLSEMRRNRNILLVQPISNGVNGLEGLLTDIELHHTELHRQKKPAFRSEEPRKKDRK